MSPADETGPPLEETLPKASPRRLSDRVGVVLFGMALGVGLKV